MHILRNNYERVLASNLSENLLEAHHNMNHTLMNIFGALAGGS